MSNWMKVYIMVMANNAYAVDYFGYFTWQPDMCEREVKITDLYENVYSQLKGVNATLDGIDEATGADVEREYVKAEAYGLRGFYLLFTCESIWRTLSL